MARSKYGTTPWGAWFLRMLESYDGEGRVSRGKSYANTGKVDSLVITGNKVAARVAGHYDPWYYISLTFPRISEPNRKKLEKILTEHLADFIALGSGTMTERLVTLFEAKDIRFIPRRWSLIESDCSCPDSASLCKHIAAVLYILAKEIDHDPRLLFQLAGIGLAELREKILPTAGNMSIEPALTAVPEQGASPADNTAADSAMDVTPAAGTAVLETPNTDTVAAGGTIAGQVSDTALETPATGNSSTAGAQRKARQSGAAGRATKASSLLVPSEPEYEHPVPLSLRCADEPAQDVPAELPRFPLEESFLPLISALLPPLTPFYDDDLVAAFKELYHKLIVRQNKEFELTLEQRIAVLMKSGTGCASAATLCDSSRLLYTPVRLDMAKLPTQKTTEGPAERSSVAAPRAASERYGGRADTRASTSPVARRYTPYGFSGRYEGGIYGIDTRRAACRRVCAAAGGIPRSGNAETGDILEAADFGAGCFRCNRPLRFLYYRSIFSAS